MSVAGDEHVAVHLTLEVAEGVAVAPRDDLVPVAEADSEALDVDDLLLGVRRVLVEFALHDVDLGSNALEEVEGLLGAEVARAEDVVDLPGDKKGLELVGNLVGTCGDVKIADDKDKNHFLIFFSSYNYLLCNVKKKL